jgi:hypothetical protein
MHGTGDAGLLHALTLKEVSGVDEPAHGEPGWLVKKSKAKPGGVFAFAKNLSEEEQIQLADAILLQRGLSSAVKQLKAREPLTRHEQTAVAFVCRTLNLEAEPEEEPVGTMLQEAQEVVRSVPQAGSRWIHGGASLIR